MILVPTTTITTATTTNTTTDITTSSTITTTKATITITTFTEFKIRFSIINLEKWFLLFVSYSLLPFFKQSTYKP